MPCWDYAIKPLKPKKPVSRECSRPLASFVDLSTKLLHDLVTPPHTPRIIDPSPLLKVNGESSQRSKNCLFAYQSAYFVPSIAVPCDLEVTSKTFCPPHESLFDSSCMERKFHSALPVIGSTGMLRINLSFLP